ncbi:hypothetical protein NUACC21_34610 [Scytonema sp. NUACC21]
MAGLILGPAMGYFKRVHENDIKAHKQVEFSLEEAIKFLFPSLLVGIKLGLSILGYCLIFMPVIYNSNVKTALIFGLIAGLFFGTVVAISLAIGNGLIDRAIENIGKPNQGIWNSRDQALIIAVVSAMLFGIIYVLILLMSQKTNIMFLITGSCFAVITGIVTAIAHTSGTSCYQHFVLRFILERDNDIPKNYADFLDYTTVLAFLQKIGGGYIFNESLRDHFAKLELNQE